VRRAGAGGLVAFLGAKQTISIHLSPPTHTHHPHMARRVKTLVAEVTSLQMQLTHANAATATSLISPLGGGDAVHHCPCCRLRGGGGSEAAFAGPSPVHGGGTGATTLSSARSPMSAADSVGSKRSRRSTAGGSGAASVASESTARHTRGTGSFDDAEGDRSVRARLDDLAVASDSGGEGYDEEPTYESSSSFPTPAAGGGGGGVGAHSVFGGRALDRTWALPNRLHTGCGGCDCALECQCDTRGECATLAPPPPPSGPPLLSPHLSFSLLAGSSSLPVTAPPSPTDSTCGRHFFPSSAALAAHSSSSSQSVPAVHPAAAVVPPTSTTASTWSAAVAPSHPHAHLPSVHTRVPVTSSSTSLSVRGAHTGALPLTPQAAVGRHTAASRTAAVGALPSLPDLVLEGSSGCDDLCCHAVSGGASSASTVSTISAHRMPRALSPTSRCHDVDLRAAAVGEGARQGGQGGALPGGGASRRHPHQPLIADADAEADAVRSAVMVLLTGFRHAAPSCAPPSTLVADPTPAGLLSIA